MPNTDIDRDNLEDFLVNEGQNKVGEETLKFASLIGQINSIGDVANLYKIFKEVFTKDVNNEIKKFERTSEEIFKSRIYSGCNDAGLILSTILRIKKIPTIFVSTACIDWVLELQSGSEEARLVKGHIFLEIYLNNKWYLFDSMAGKIYDNYDYNNLSLPSNCYVFDKGLNNYNFGAYTLSDNQRIMRDIFKNFDVKKYTKPIYPCTSLKEIVSSKINEVII